MTFQAIAMLSNRESLCIGAITEREAELARESDPSFDRFGLYLLSVDAQDPRAPGKVLAKFTSEDAAKSLAQFFRLQGALES